MSKIPTETEIVLKDEDDNFLTNAFCKTPHYPKLVVWHDRYFIREWGCNYREAFPAHTTFSDIAIPPIEGERTT